MNTYTLMYVLYTGCFITVDQYEKLKTERHKFGAQEVTRFLHRFATL